MNIIEIWKPVKGYEGLYEISNLGRVKSIGNDKSRKDKILKPGKYGGGYLRVCLSRNGKHKMFSVHRLVATAFLPNPEGLEQINHKDENKSNNCVSNIEWCDAKYNTNYGSRNERITSTQRNDPAKSKLVEASKFSDFRTIEFRFASTREADRNGFNHGNVGACCRGCYYSKGNFYKGLFWRYAS